MPFFDFLPDDATVRDIMFQQPERFLPICGVFTQDVMRGPSPLSVAEREIVATYTSGLNQCQYCTGAHSAFAAALRALCLPLITQSGRSTTSEPSTLR